MTTLYILEDSPIPAGFAMDSQESIHLYLPNGDLFDVWTRGQFFGSDLDFYEINGDEAQAYLAERGWFDEPAFDEDDGQPDEYTEWQDYYGGDDWDHGQYDEGY